MIDNRIDLVNINISWPFGSAYVYIFTFWDFYLAIHRSVVDNIVAISAGGTWFATWLGYMLNYYFSCRSKKNNGHLKVQEWFWFLAITNKALYVRNIVTLRGTKKICCGLASSERSEVLAKPNRFFLSLLKLQYF